MDDEGKQGGQMKIVAESRVKEIEPRDEEKG